MGKEIVPRATPRTVLAQKKRRLFLRILAETGNVKESAQACGYTDTSVLKKFRRENEDFAEEWDNALDSGTDILVSEANRRAVEGTLKPILYKGEIVTYLTEYSDALLMFLLRAARPDTYRENARGGETNVNFGIAVIPMTAQNEADWQDRAILMHDKQQPIVIEAKPVENQMARVERGD